MKNEHVVIVVLGILLLICLDKFQKVETAQAMYTDMTAEQRADFISWALTPDMSRAIAEDFCATNQNTKRICFNATKW